MNVSGLETIQRDYGDDVEFYYIYKSLAHPNLNGYVEPHTLDERVMHVREASRTLDTQWTWLIDNMDNEFKHAMGGLPNSEFVIDPEGGVVRARVWSNAAELRADLEELIGAVEDPTTIDELDMTFQPPPELAPSGVVDGVDRPGRARALRVVPRPAEDATEPFYVKLRAEAGRALIDDGEGDLVLSFRPDPIYGVHWNNLVEPIRVEIEAPEGVEVSESSLTGPTVTDHEADVDPREFLISVDGATADTPLRITAHYFACTDEWCRPFTNEYDLFIERDGDGGSAMTRRMAFADRQRSGGSRRGARGGNQPDQMRAMFDMMDENKDGRISGDEAPAEIIEDLDQDGDGAISFEEAAAEFRRNQGGNRGNRNGARPRRYAPVVGQWNMVTMLGEQQIDAVMTIRITEDGELAGDWASMGRDMPLDDLAFEDGVLTFTRSIGTDDLTFRGEVDGNRIEGVYTGEMGELESNGERVPQRAAQGGRNPDRVRMQFDRMDQNEDGTLVLDELPERMKFMFERMDADKDGKVTFEEFTRMPRGAGRRGGGGGGGGGGE